MREKKKTTKRETPPPLSLAQELDGVLERHGADGARVLIFETAERDERGERRWSIFHRGNPGTLQLMLAHTIGWMSARHERQIAEIMRSAGDNPK